MWRLPTSIIVAAVLGSVVATIICTLTSPLLPMLEMSPHTTATALEMIVLTLPGATLLGVVEVALIRWGKSGAFIDAMVVIAGGIGGAASFGLMRLKGVDWAAATFGATYGLATAIIFVASERLLQTRRLSPP